MVRLRDKPSTDKDWFSQLSGTYLKKRITEAASRGAESDYHGVSPVHAIARAVDIGRGTPYY